MIAVANEKQTSEKDVVSEEMPKLFVEALVLEAKEFHDVTFSQNK